MKKQLKGQGAVANVHQRFSEFQVEHYYEDLLEENLDQKLQLIEVFPKTIVNQNKGGKVPEFTLNPYQGCEHGCSYCYARPTHEYWSYNAGLDFERIILYKKTAPELLKKYFAKRNYKVQPIVVSGNTDCYQPIESKLKITQQLLETFLEHRHPLGIITKNALILRDLELLKELAKLNLVHVVLSINTVDESLRRTMEPRTSSVKNRWKALEILRKNGVPTSVIIAPIIPGLNSEDVLAILKKAAELDACDASYTVVRLNDTTQPVFLEWIEEHYPNKKDKVINHIRSMYNGELGNLSSFQKRGGKGKIIDSIKQSYTIGKQKYFGQKPKFEFSTEHFIPVIDGQYKLFE